MREVVIVDGVRTPIGKAVREKGLMVTLSHEMRRRGAKLGVATMCTGIGQGIATVVEQV
jgi:3-oxo-5,6-didehydrosuberyl-CoA/3-oxoadipyl-CoA thiolase